MPYIHGGPMVHIPRPPTPPPKSGWSRFAGKAKAKHQERSARFAQKVQNKTGNYTSKKADRYKGEGKFGERTAGQINERSERRHINLSAALTGATIGGLAATPVGIGGARRDRQIEANKKKLAKRWGGGTKEQVHLITDVATKAATLKTHHPGRVGMAAMGVGAAGTGALELNYRKNQKKTLATQRAQLRARKPVSKARSMSDTELRHRQKIQGKIARTTSTMGLSGLAVTGAGVLAHKNKGVLRAIQKIPKLKGATPEGMKNVAINTGIVSGGIGGVGGFNQASIYSAESRRRKQAVPVKKDYGMDMGYFGEEGTPLLPTEIEAEIEKAWSPSASNFDSERSRQKRNRSYQSGALVTAGAGGAYGASEGVKAVQAGRKLKKGSQLKQLTKEGGVLRHAGKAGIGAGVVGAAAGTHHLIERKKQGSWQPYAKRDTASAFGVDHNDDPSGQHRETEN